MICVQSPEPTWQGESWLSQVVLWPPYMGRHTHAHTIYKKFLIMKKWKNKIHWPWSSIILPNWNQSGIPGKLPCHKSDCPTLPGWLPQSVPLVFDSQSGSESGEGGKREEGNIWGKVWASWDFSSYTIELTGQEERASYNFNWILPRILKGESM